MPVVVTYKQVFGVDLGDEVQETHGVNWTPAPATASLRKQLFKTPYYTQNPGKVQGVGPLFVDWGNGVLKHEYNRHHAGLAVDIMLKKPEVPLGHALVLALNRLGSIMNWRSIIYQDVTINLTGNGSRTPTVYRGGDHDDHIHIDWFQASPNVQWTNITDVPLRRINGDKVTMKAKNGSRIANSIEWTSEAATVFENDPTVAQELTQATTAFQSGQLQAIDLKKAVGIP